MSVINENLTSTTTTSTERRTGIISIVRMFIVGCGYFLWRMQSTACFQISARQTGKHN